MISLYRFRLAVCKFRSLSIAVLVACLTIARGSSAVEMPYVEPELRDRPPVAAPTNRIEVAPIVTVRSQSEKLEDFAAGLIQGLMSREPGVRGVAFVAVQGDHLIVQKYFGTTQQDTLFEIGSLSDFLAGLAAMREIERGTLVPDDDVSKPLGEASLRNLTVAQVLTHQGGDFPLLVQLVEKTSGESLTAYLQANFFVPLAMSAGGEGPLRLDAAGLGHLMIALVNGGVYGSVPMLQPETVAAMVQTYVTPHPALPGWSYGFSEMRRNNWRSYQRDGVSSAAQMRLVVVPDARIAYFIAVDGRADAQFWRTLDGALFDSAFPPQAANDGALAGMAAPTLDDARAAAGSYEQPDSYAAQVAPLKMESRRLDVRAINDGALVVSGAVLAPKPGGYWASVDGNVVAALREGTFIVGTGQFVPLALWKRPLVYALLALLAAITGAGFGYYEFVHRKRAWRLQSVAVLAPSGVTGHVRAAFADRLAGRPGGVMGGESSGTRFRRLLPCFNEF